MVSVSPYNGDKERRDDTDWPDDRERFQDLSLLIYRRNRQAFKEYLESEKAKTVDEPAELIDEQSNNKRNRRRRTRTLSSSSSDFEYDRPPGTYDPNKNVNTSKNTAKTSVCNVL